MRTLSSTLLTEQKKPTRRPVIKLEVQEYGHPEKAGSIQWELFAWEKLHGDSTTQNFHGVALPADGSLNRLRLAGTTIYHQRVTDPGPGSNYASWTNLGNTIASSHLAIAAHGTEVMVAAAGAANLYRRQSADSGATWAAWVQMANARPCERGCAVAYKPNADCAIVHASDVNDPSSLYIQTRTGGGWSGGLGQRAGTWEIEGLAMYYDGDWNIIALVLEGSYLSAVRMIYGDGDQVAAGTWGTDQKISLGRARVDIAAQLALRRFQTQPRYARWEYEGKEYTRKYTGPKEPATYWERRQAVLEALAGESLDVSGASLTLPDSYPALLSLARSNLPWVYRLQPGSEFIDYNWSKASNISTSAPYGLAIGCDDTYIYATQANEVWRTPIPADWTPPTPGSGAGDKVTIPYKDILKVIESIAPEQQSELDVELDNSKGAYNSPGEGDIAEIKRGSRVNFHIGYRTSADDTEEVGRYFIESWGYTRSPSRALFTLHCVDAWGLLERFQFNKPVEWNISADDYTVYDLVEKVMLAIDGTLSYKTRSSAMTTLYPRLDVHAGESAASVLSRLLALVPDVIFFFGLTGYIVYPQAADIPVYGYFFPHKGE